MQKWHHIINGKTSKYVFFRGQHRWLFIAQSGEAVAWKDERRNEANHSYKFYLFICILQINKSPKAITLHVLPPVQRQKGLNMSCPQLNYTTSTSFIWTRNILVTVQRLSWIKETSHIYLQFFEHLKLHSFKIHAE